MTMIVLRLLPLLGLRCRWHRHFSRLRPVRSGFSRGVGGRWIRGLLAQNPCAIGIEAVHDPRGLLWTRWTPGKADSTKSDVALERLGEGEAERGRLDRMEMDVADRRRLAAQPRPVEVVDLARLAVQDVEA